MIKNFYLFLIILLISSCSFQTLTFKGKNGDLKLKQVDFTDLPGWQKDQQNETIHSFLNSCLVFAKIPQNKNIGRKVGYITPSDFDDVCDIAKAIREMSDAQARNFFENWFVPFKVANRSGKDRGLFTGYYVPEIKGSKIKTAIYKYPVHKKPYDPKDLTLTRKEVANGALENKGLELLYLDNPVDLFFMQVQGSGRILLENGEIIRLGFGGKNKYKYSSIGKHIIENNILGDVTPTYFAIKSWLKDNPEEARKVLNINKSYIFFKPSKSDDVFGSQGAPLTAERSLAVDHKIIPEGLPVWLNISSKKKPYRKLVVSQDTGSAIKGAIRGDVFFGKGSKSEKLAARMNHYGEYFLLLPTAAVDRMVGRN
ncbi:MAG: membrane-bound lytic murein transglycosylase A [Lentimonas sp.]|jgi:membrane-bound lytic murein transglycosylase A